MKGRSLTRRQFIRVVAAASAAAAGLPARGGRAAQDASSPLRGQRDAPAGARRVRPRWTRAQQAELVKQVAQLEKTLRKIRDYSLPAGSEPAGRFVPLLPRRPGRR